MKKIVYLFIFNLISILNYSQTIESQIDSILSKTYAKNDPGIVALVAKNENIIYRNALGQSNLEMDMPMKPENVFQIGSITKQFTAIAILMLEEQGKLSIKDPVSKYLPEYGKIGKDMSIQHLLSHTSGINNRTPVGGANFISRTDMTSRELFEYFKDEPLVFQPGESFKYSNAGYILLGLIIEIVSEQSYEEFIETNIFNSLGMDASYFGSHSEIIKNRAQGYKKTQNFYENAEYMSLTLPFSAGSIMTTADDLFTWHKALYAHTLLSASSFKKAITPTVLNNGKTIPYGYGFRIAHLGESSVIAHGGNTKGFSSMAMYLPEEDIYMVLLSNCNCKKISNTAKKIAMLFAMTKQVSDTDSTSYLSVSQDILKEYIGEYEVKKDVYLKIGLDDSNQFYLLAPGQTQKISLFAKSENTFVMKVSNATLTFNRNDKNKVFSLTMHQSGRSINALKK